MKFGGKEYPTVQKAGVRYALTVSIETRGEGGYVQTAPSPGYSLMRGDLASLPVLTAEEVKTLLAISRSLSEHIAPNVKVIENKRVVSTKGGDLRPGDAYNQVADLPALLAQHGWSVTGSAGERVFLARPGKAKGVSATYNYADSRMLYVFSSNAYPFESGSAYDAFAVRAVLEYGGDFSACARACRVEGYGGENGGVEGVQLILPAANAPAPLTTAPTQQTEWDSLLPLGTGQLPVFPIDILPPLLRSFAQSAAHSIQVPLDLMGMLMLAVSATLMAKTAEVVVTDNYRESLNLFLCAILPPASRKSAGFKRAVKPLMQWEAEIQAEQAAAIQQYQTQKAVLTGRRQEAMKRVQQGDEDAQTELDEIERQLRELTPVQKTTLWADDSTPEMLALLLAQNDGKMSLLSAEGGVFDMMAGKYGNGTSLDVYLKGHAQDAMRVNRKGQANAGEEGFTIPDPTLTVAVTVQPAVLSGLSAKNTMIGRGLMARFLYFYPVDLAGHRLTDTSDIPTHVLTAYTQYVRTVGSWTPDVADVAGNGVSAPHAIRMSAEARSLRSEFEMEIDRRLGKGGDLHGLADWAGKLAGHCVRVAGLLHLSRHADEPAPWRLELSGDTMQDAIVLGRYLIQHARAAYAEMHADVDEEAARKLLDWIIGNRLTQFSQRDVQRKVHCFRRAEHLRPPVQLLTEHAYIREAVVPGEDGRTRKIWEVNPALYTDADAVSAAPIPPVYEPVCEKVDFEMLDVRETPNEYDWRAAYGTPVFDEEDDLQVPDWGYIEGVESDNTPDLNAA